MEAKVRVSDERVGGLDANIDGLRGDIRVLCRMAGATLAGVAAVWGIVIIIALHFMPWSELGHAQCEQHRVVMPEMNCATRQSLIRG